ncbi:hypothetical protein DAPPUDRAFT_317183 [Daphnia pulex]|uniref:Uncharacterized protein n=1 Tax=Daphnia pulex TaxID=6669 RepID=E9GF67_DAPPU|nr:hypothetical protein DAPPUDRAFT_317183 [Daphnia pulex]|eukprot:EFX81586.1 hypothetical protein DAPPUDRAFT_317183 [Daphnia pulex]
MSVDESLESDLNCLDLTTGFQELHSDLVSTQDQLRVARQERADFLQQRNAVVDQQNQIEDACQKDKENEAAKIFKNFRQSRSAGYTNCAAVDVPSSSSDDSDHEKAPPKKAKTNVPLKLEPTKHSSPFTMLCLGKLCAITVCGVPDFLKKTDIRIPDGNGEDIYKFLIKMFNPLEKIFRVENAYLSDVGKNIFLVPFNNHFDYFLPTPLTVKCNVCDESIDPMIMDMHKVVCVAGAWGYEGAAFDANDY